MRRKKRKKNRAPDTIFGIAWFSEDQWSLLREVAADPEKLEETYAEYTEMFEEGIEDLATTGTEIRKVEIEVKELLEWCDKQGRRVDGKARANFAAIKLHENMKANEENNRLDK